MPVKRGDAEGAEISERRAREDQIHESICFSQRLCVLALLFSAPLRLFECKPMPVKRGDAEGAEKSERRSNR
jgi:hypothetical protein